MKTFEFDGEKYRKASALQKEWGTKIISKLNLTGSETILDLGCGDGILTEKLAQLVPKGKVIGIDASQGMIEIAKELKRNNLIFKVMNINKINFKNEFDLIFSNSTLHWIKDHEKLITNCFEALKPNGMIRFNFAGKRNISHFSKVIREVMGYLKYKKYFTNYEWPWYMPNINEYKNLINRFNFRGVKVWEENADRYYQEFDEIMKWIDQPVIVPFLKCVDEKDKKEFRDTVVKKIIEETSQKDGTYFETFRRIHVFARK